MGWRSLYILYSMYVCMYVTLLLTFQNCTHLLLYPTVPSRRLSFSTRHKFHCRKPLSCSIEARPSMTLVSWVMLDCSETIYILFLESHPSEDERFNVSFKLARLRLSLSVVGLPLEVHPRRQPSLVAASKLQRRQKTR